MWKGAESGAEGVKGRHDIWRLCLYVDSADRSVAKKCRHLIDSPSKIPHLSSRRIRGGTIHFLIASIVSDHITITPQKAMMDRGIQKARDHHPESETNEIQSG